MSNPTETALDLLMLAKGQIAGNAWSKALAEVADHLVLVAKNNPNKPVKQILSRQDVKQAISEPFAMAGARTVVEVQKAWYARAGNTDLPPDELKKITDDAKRNAVRMPVLLRSIIRASTHETLENNLAAFAKNYALRAEFAVDYADRRALALSKLSDGKKGDKVQWYNTPWAGQCSFCAAMNGVTVPFGSTFPTTAGGRTLNPYLPLYCPPAHPRCRCRVRVLRDGKPIHKADE